ncbi:carbohydrate kinase family protein [Methylophaga pinxianii]|uniref:carbohydrate kinase family protein n=1 Tax=Methylophaga pinxianii TaxID=2881052 RepID=UPI001CF21CD7|nr:carbohydrate kinase [Methylophaga pinxianii]MCB2425668.1 carbohydrate kinase [Methylophaga pinxianii]UPH44913.1 carbohydrate kinase [Methylophaga pinxianii]
MSQQPALAIFGEVLFDCFPDESKKLGGAPFNVAWHLQAFGDDPLFISRVGDDASGEKIRQAMQQWQFSMTGLQTDKTHSTGEVKVTLQGGEPSYEITADKAYDFISTAELPTLRNDAVLYHGSLALRNSVSKAAFESLTRPKSISVFMDVNLRTPWWSKEEIYRCLERARWCKLNQNELVELGFNSADLQQDMTRMQTHFQLEQLIVTRGEEGAIVRCNDGTFYEQKCVAVDTLMDSVGAGDAFTAMYIHGLLADWPVQKILLKAQQFASQVIGLRGAISEDPAFYAEYT